MAGGIDLFSGNSITGTNLFKVNKNPLNQLDGGTEDVLGKQGKGVGDAIWQSVQMLIDTLLGIDPNGPAGGVVGDITNMLENVWTFLGDLNPTSPNFDPIAAIENFITTMLDPTNLLAPLEQLFAGVFTIPNINIPGLDASKITSGQFPQNMIMGLETALSDLASGDIQGAIDAILASVGFAPGTGTTTDLTSYFNDLMSMLGLPNLTSSGFSPVTAVETFITDLVQPTSLLAPLEQLLPGVFTVPNINIPGLDASKITSGQFPQNMIIGLETALSDLASGNIQGAIDAILASVGFAPGTGTTTDVTQYFNDLLSMLGQPPLTSSGFNSSSAVSTFINDLVNPLNLLAPLESLAPGVFTIPQLNIPGLDASKVTSGTFPQNMLNITSIAANIVTGVFGAGQIPGLDASKIISGVLGVFSIPNITMPMSTDMTTIVNGVLSAMGMPTGQPASSVQTALTNIPGLNIISTLLGSVIPGLDASKIISGIFGTGLIPNLDASKIVSGVLGALQIPGLDASKVTSGQFAQNMVVGLPSALASMLTGSSPLNAFNLFNQIPTTLLGMVPYSNVGPTTATNLLSIPGFDGSGSIVTQSGTWIWLATDGHTSLGCAQATANGTLQTLLSNTIGVGQGQQMSLGAWVKYTGLTATAGQNAIRINVAAYLGATLVTTQQVAGIASPSGSTGWVQMSGNWTVPAGVDNIVVQLVVTQNALAGTVLYDDATATKTGLMNGNWMSGISGTVAADIQSAVDQIFQASGGTGTNNPLSSILGSLTDFPGSNITSLLGGSVIPGLDASKIVTGVLGTPQVPNITLPMSSDLQGLNDYITNTLLGVVGQFIGTNLPQSNASMGSLYNNLNTATTNIQNMRSMQTANTVSGGGVNVAVDFSGYPDGPLPSMFTTTYTGTGSSALGIKGGNSGWNPLNNDGNRTAHAVYNVQPTNTDYQIVRGSMASAPGGSTSGGQPRIGGTARVDNPANPQNYVWARAYCTGFLTYKADVGCTVGGVDTVFLSGVALTWSMDISVVVGANGNPRRYQAYSGTQLVLDYTEAGTTSQYGPGFRYWGCKTEMKTGSGGAGNPGTIASTSVSDNAPPVVLGSTFRISRHNTATVSYSNSGLTSPFKLPANFFDTLDYASPDITWDGLNLTINTEGTYLINVRYKASNIPSNSKIDGAVWVNNVVARQLGSNFADSYLANSGDGVVGSTALYVHAGDYLNFGYASNGAGSLTGEGTGTTSYVEVALMNRSMY